MSILVAYASKHGATEGIAERIGERLRAAGLEVEVRPAGAVRDLAAYDAFVVGSAVYMFHWMKEAARFLRRNQAVLAEQPVWLFSSGPLGTEATDPQGHDLLAVSAPKGIAELEEAVNARGHRVFFGAFHRGKPSGFGERMVAVMPAARAALPEGDFRDWDDIGNWAESIAHELSED